MVTYNIYHNNSKINTKPLSLADVNDIMGQEYISKKINATTVQRISTAEIKITKCIVI